ncbi:hypothetical protein YC2023_091451 [Brassica napus]
MLYLAYEGEHTIHGGPAVTPAGSFGRKMSANDLIAHQMHVSRQEKSHYDFVSFDRDCANALHHYVCQTARERQRKVGRDRSRVRDDEGWFEMEIGPEDDLIAIESPEPDMAR